MAINNYLSIESRVKEANLMFDTIIKVMENIKDENTKKILLLHITNFAVSHEKKTVLIEWLEKGVSVPGYILQSVFYNPNI